MPELVEDRMLEPLLQEMRGSGIGGVVYLPPHRRRFAERCHMPVVRISFLQDRPSAYRRAIADSVHRALVEATGVSELDRFQVIAEHTPESLVYDPTYLDVGRNDDMVFVQIALDGGCPTDRKRALYGRILELFARNVGVRSQDVLISLIEVSRENRSPGNCRARQA